MLTTMMTAPMSMAMAMVMMAAMRRARRQVCWPTMPIGASNTPRAVRAPLSFRPTAIVPPTRNAASRAVNLQDCNLGTALVEICSTANAALVLRGFNLHVGEDRRGL
jgi:hypothetical protein